MSELVGAMPFAERLGLSVESATREEVRGSFDWAEELCTAGGVLHGGALIRPKGVRHLRRCLTLVCASC